MQKSILALALCVLHLFTAEADLQQSSECQQMNCSHSCVLLYHGMPHCACPTHLALGSDERSCIVADLQQQSSGCQQLNCSHTCVLLFGSSPSCGCPQHQTRGPDDSSCVEPVYFLLSLHDNITLYREDTREFEPLGPSTNSVLAFNHKLQEIYSYSKENHAILRYSKTELLGSKVVDSKTEVLSLAVDWLRDELYWISDHWSVLKTCFTNGSSLRDLAVFRGPGPYTWDSLAVDPYVRKLFWLEGSKVRILDQTTDVLGHEGRIQKVCLDMVGEALALDTNSQLIYVIGRRSCGQGKKRVIRMHYDGTHKEEVVLHGRRNPTKIQGFGVLGELLYWYDNYDRTTTQLNKYHFSTGADMDMSDLMVWNPQDVYDMKIYLPDIQKPAVVQKSDIQ